MHHSLEKHRQKYLSILSPPTSSQHLPGYKAGKRMFVLGQGQHFEIYSMGNLVYTAMNILAGNSLLRIQTF